MSEERFLTAEEQIAVIEALRKSSTPVLRAEIERLGILYEQMVEECAVTAEGLAERDAEIERLSILYEQWKMAAEVLQAQQDSLRAAVIEECARVAEKRADSWRDLDGDQGTYEVLELEGRDIVAAIRALKDRT